MVTGPRDCSWVLRDSGFGSVTPQSFKCASDPENDYNCIAWAVGDTENFWWPRLPLAPYYWPDGLPRWPIHVAETMPNFVAALRTRGFRVCRNGRFSFRYQKIALYVTADGRPKHAARLLPSGAWSSKLGSDEDIEHSTLECIEGSKYGTVKLFLKRKWPEDQKPKPKIFRWFPFNLLGRARAGFSPIPKKSLTAR